MHIKKYECDIILSLTLSKDLPKMIIVSNKTYFCDNNSIHRNVYGIYNETAIGIKLRWLEMV